jgi:hypothetical protein
MIENIWVSIFLLIYIGGERLQISTIKIIKHVGKLQLIIMRLTNILQLFHSSPFPGMCTGHWLLLTIGLNEAHSSFFNSS